MLVLGRADIKMVHALGMREDVEQEAPQAVEVHTLLIVGAAAFTFLVRPIKAIKYNFDCAAHDSPGPITPSSTISAISICFKM